MLGSSFAPLSYTLISAECESADAYREAYRSVKFVTEVLELEANVCQTHATAITKNNGTHCTYFDSNENYEVFHIMRCSFPDAGMRPQELLVLWLRSIEETRAADWFERYWCGPIKGRWLLANVGITITGNNQGLESTWRWDRMAMEN